jgi:DNA-binding MarR family transcriptional regulator
MESFLERRDQSVETESMDAIVRIEKNMRYINGIIKHKGREILKNYGITTPQFIALQWLLEDGDLTIGELSNKINLAFSTTTDLVDRMEKNMLVERKRDTKDRRVVRIHLLDKGKEIIQEVIEKRQQYLAEVLYEMSTSDVSALDETMRVLLEKMQWQKEQNN